MGLRLLLPEMSDHRISSSSFGSVETLLTVRDVFFTTLEVPRVNGGWKVLSP
jgi:hypothetical protein